MNGAFSPQVERFLQLQLHLFPILNSWVSASNVSHTVVLRPLKAGYFNFTSATITYLAQEDGPVVVSGPNPLLDGAQICLPLKTLQKISKAAAKF